MNHDIPLTRIVPTCKNVGTEPAIPVMPGPYICSSTLYVVYNCCEHHKLTKI